MQYLLCPRHGWATGVPVANCSAHTACGLNDTAWDTFLSLAVSRTDGDTWEKPALHQVNWRNSTANNIVIRGPTDGTRKIGCFLDLLLFVSRKERFFFRNGGR